jgi:hypothetical protein
MASPGGEMLHRGREVSMNLCAVVRVAGVFVAAVLAGGLGGCSLEPRYSVKDVAFDPGLVGVWEFQGKAQEGEKPPPPVRAEFSARRLGVDDGRIDPNKVVKPPAEDPNAYTITVKIEEGKTQEIGGFILRAGEVRLLGMQHVGGDVGGGLFTHPLHNIWRLRRDGDVLELTPPKYGLAWIPASQPLDAPAPDATGKRPVPTIDDLAKRKDGGTFIAFDIDRLLEVYRAHAADPAFWQEEPVVGKRVPQAPSSGAGHGSQPGAK